MSYGTIDADGHVSEPDEIWAARLDDRLKPYAPRRVFDTNGRFRHLVAGELRPGIPMPDTGWELPSGGFDPVQRLRDMDGQGVERAVLFPTTGLYFGGIENTEAQVALCRVYDDWLAEYCATDSARLLGIAVVPQNDLVECIREARRAVRELGFKGVMLRPNPIAGRTLDHAFYEPLWDALEELDVPLCLHEGTTQDVIQSGRERYENFMFRHVCSHPHEQQMGLLSLICGGVLERHPRLRVLCLESGCGWIAHWLERLDEHAESWGHAGNRLAQLPSWYFERQGFISCDPAEKTIPGMVDVIGNRTIVFATDYPHPDALGGDVVGEIAKRDGLSEESKRRILRENAQRCFGLD